MIMPGEQYLVFSCNGGGHKKSRPVSLISFLCYDEKQLWQWGWLGRRIGA